MKLKNTSFIIAYILMFAFPVALYSSQSEKQPLLPKKDAQSKRCCPTLTVGRLMTATGGLMTAAFFCFGVIRILPVPHSNLVIGPCNNCLKVDPTNVCGAIDNSDSRIREACPNAIITRSVTSYSIFPNCETFDSAMERVAAVCPPSTTLHQSPLANKFKKKKD